MKKKLLIIFLLFFHEFTFAECEIKDNTPVAIDYDFGVISRPIGAKAGDLIHTVDIPGKAGRLTCSENSKVYLTANNEEVLSYTSSMSGKYPYPIDGRTAYFFNSGYVFTVQDIETGEEVYEYPRSIEKSVNTSEDYIPPSIRVRIYASDNGDDIFSDTLIRLHYVAYLLNTRYPESRPKPSTSKGQLFTYRLKGRINAPPATCRIQNGKNLLQLNLPKVAIASFPDKGFTQDSNGIAEDYFDIKCNSSQASVFITSHYDNYENVNLYSGTGFATKGSVFKSQNEGTNGNAKGIGVILSSNENFYVPFLVGEKVRVRNVNKEARINIYAKYYRYSDEYSAGKISGSINFDLISN